MTTPTTTATDVTTIEPIGHREGVELARVEYRRFADALAELDSGDWGRPTDCEGWTVRDLAGHVVGAMRAAASMREMIRQQREISRRARADGGNETDHMTALQVELTADLTAGQLAAECRDLVDAAADGRARIPAVLRRFVSFPVEIGALSERWRLGYLVDVILTRDIWLHRVDLARAMNAEPTLDGTHDRRIVADVVAEWARRHRSPFGLDLTGMCGGSYRAGAGGPDLTLPAVEFCRTLSGRAPGDGLLAQEVPF